MALGNSGWISQQKFFFCAVMAAFFLASFIFLFRYQEPAPAGWTVGANWRNAFALPASLGAIKDTFVTGKESCERYFGRMFETWVSAYRRCLLDNMKGRSKWNQLHVAVNSCMGSTVWNMLDVHYLYNQDDVKLVILPSQIKPNATPPEATAQSTGFDCVEVTLGIGNDIEAEEKLRDIVPFCRFFGADPIAKSGKVFEKLGQYYELAVGWQAGNLTANVLENNHYHLKTVPTITFADFLKNYAKVDHVDYAFLDNEGPEYGMFEQFLPGGELATNDVSICQISVEMHGPIGLYQMEKKFDSLITGLVNSTAFLPFWSARPMNHMRSYYVNIRDKYCLDTYFKNRFCSRVSTQ